MPANSPQGVRYRRAAEQHAALSAYARIYVDTLTTRQSFAEEQESSPEAVMRAIRATAQDMRILELGEPLKIRSKFTYRDEVDE
jgi:hypothetical protein